MARGWFNCYFKNTAFARQPQIIKINTEIKEHRKTGTSSFALLFCMMSIFWTIYHFILCFWSFLTEHHVEYTSPNPLIMFTSPLCGCMSQWKYRCQPDRPGKIALYVLLRTGAILTVKRIFWHLFRFLVRWVAKKLLMNYWKNSGKSMIRLPYLRSRAFIWFSHWVRRAQSIFPKYLHKVFSQSIFPKYFPKVFAQSVFPCLKWGSLFSPIQGKQFSNDRN